MSCRRSACGILISHSTQESKTECVRSYLPFTFRKSGRSSRALSLSNSSGVKVFSLTMPCIFPDGVQWVTHYSAVGKYSQINGGDFLSFGEVPIYDLENHPRWRIIRRFYCRLTANLVNNQAQAASAKRLVTSAFGEKRCFPTISLIISCQPYFCGPVALCLACRKASTLLLSMRAVPVSTKEGIGAKLSFDQSVWSEDGLW